jgi:quercetin dioxygenase-like cupin family protein
MTDLRGVVRHGPATDLLRILLSTRDSAGEVAVVEMEMPAGSAGPPLHVHPTHGEGFYVLAGQLTVQVGQDVITGGPGTWVYAPSGTPHSLANFGADAARLLCIFAPGGFERRFERLLAQQNRQDVRGELAELSQAERATQVIGPPLAAPPQPQR